REPDKWRIKKRSENRSVFLSVESGSGSEPRRLTGLLREEGFNAGQIRQHSCWPPVYSAIEGAQDDHRNT
ncbi:MAG: hypothetical protein EBS68_09900, partial [Rhodobacteraceae bacterium]|nr:hypothetical protein [Paracoccaceae bacterium]